MTKYEFRPITRGDVDLVFSWLDEPHMKEFWDNSKEHREDIENFADGREKESTYFNGAFDYWLGFVAGEAFCIILTHEEHNDMEMPEYISANLSKKGRTFGIDFGIGNTNYLGKGHGSKTLIAFMDFFAKQSNSTIGRFLIDPFKYNPRAIHVYKKAGFEIVQSFVQEGGFFYGTEGVLMIKDV